MELFLRDNHSSNIVKIDDSEENISEEIQRLLISAYPEVFSKSHRICVETIGGVNINSLNFRINGRYYLKFLPIAKAGIRPELFNLISNQLIKSGFNSARYYNSYDGKSFCTYQGSKIIPESFYFLQDFISDSFFSGTKAEVQLIPLLVNRLKDIFTIQNGWIYSDAFQQNSPFVDIQIEEDWRDLKEFLSQVSMDLPVNNTRHIIPRLLEDYFSKYATSLLKLKNNPEFGIFHSDLHPHNIMVGESGSLWVIDHESFKRMPEHIYRGFSIFKLFRKSVSTGACSLDEIRDILRFNFNNSELASLEFGAQTELVRRIILILKLHFRHGDRRWNYDLLKHTAGMSECSLLFSF